MAAPHAEQDPPSTRYHRDGYCFPIRAMAAAQAHSFRERLETAERDFPDLTPLSRRVSGYGFLALPILDELMRLPGILDPVEAILGPDLMVWGTSLFIKEPRTPDFVSWHQDLHYWGLEEDDQVTAWVALSPATVQSGCMRFVPGSHRQRHVAHRDTFGDTNMLSRGQELAVEVDENEADDVVLQSGEMSLHHGRTFHASHPNRSDDRRIGVAIRYIAPGMRQVGGVKTFAALVRGEDRFDHFQLAPRPTATFDAAGLALVDEARARNRSILYRGAEQAIPA
jgi:hypothetical protein